VACMKLVKSYHGIPLGSQFFIIIIIIIIIIIPCNCKYVTEGDIFGENSVLNYTLCVKFVECTVAMLLTANLQTIFRI
jgi:hypothetical protein